MRSIGYKSGRAFGPIEIAGMNADNLTFDLSARGPLQLSRNLVTGSFFLAIHPCHFLGMEDPTGGTLLLIRLVYSGASAICSVAPFAAVLIALTLVYLRTTRRDLQRENHRVIWQRIVQAIGRDSRLSAAR